MSLDEVDIKIGNDDSSALLNEAFAGENTTRRETTDFEEYVFGIKRCTKVVKGGRKLSFSAIVVVGDLNGRVGFGLGKASEVAEAIRKGGELARKSLVKIKIQNGTVPHEVIGKFSGSRVFLRPAVPGTGVVAGGGVRAVLNLAGVHNVLSKSLGSNNPLNVVNATFAALNQLRTMDEAKNVRSSAF